MLQLKDVKKDYVTTGSTVPALKGVSLEFRANEFVSILGPSGCGKTTLLNIIGGLDHYTSGDLVVSNISTKNYSDRDWDAYRNHRIGFVFQSYNLIPHQTVLGNVELSLTIAGVSKEERRQRAEEALIRVGLEKEMKKRPNQLSGGQMQRVAIARALVNNPEILLADEPTGALDSVTSVQIMELIREIAGERLVIMVTHNPELAEQYSTRIVKLQDGLVVSDSNPYDSSMEKEEVEIKTETEFLSEARQENTPQNKIKRKTKKEKKIKTSMSFKTALGLSGRNLQAKKGRTFVTSFAGSIGIISVCLVLALSNGFNNYILKTEEDMLSAYPLEITETTMDMEVIMSGMTMMQNMPDLDKLDDKVYVNSFLTNIAQGMQVTNDLSEEYLTYISDMNKDIYSSIVYELGINLSPNIYTEVEMESGIKSISLHSLKSYYSDRLSKQEEKYAALVPLVEYLGSIYGYMPGTSDITSDDFGEYVLSQYDIVGEGHFPKSVNEAVLVIGARNDITDLTLAQLGLISEEQFMSFFPTSSNEESTTVQNVEFSKLVGRKFVLKNNNDIYTESDGTYMFDYTGEYSQAENANAGTTMTISGILRLKEGMNYGCLGSGLYFTEQLYSQFQKANESSEIATAIKEQAAQQTIVITQLQEIQKQIQDLDKTASNYLEEYRALQMQQLSIMQSGGKYLKAAAGTLLSYYVSSDALSGLYMLYGDSALRAVGGKSNPNAIKIYTDSFESKEAILSYLDSWNDTHEKEQQVRYTDTVGLMMSMMQTILNAITYVLVAFTAISLVVSSVMIGIITYVSVVERTKEIGVLRAIGARKLDIKNLFNAETFIIGLSSGAIGVGVAYMLCGFVNLILGVLTGISTLASLKVGSALIMVIVSITLTLISGLIPAQAAAKKDPVVALRTE